MLPHSPIFWMQKALDLAEKGRGRTYPNPLAGAVVVKNNKLISGGYHAFFGGPHAEVEALSRAGGRAKGATLYVTLEPCLSFGKTPPCTRLIAEKKIRRVVVAATDPNPVHAGRGIKELRARGLEVVTGILSKEAAVQNEVFFKWVTTGLPFVSLKMAESLDGKIAAVGGASRWITGEKARDFVHKLRATHQAVLVGKNTALKDNPRLNTNIKNAPQPVRVILDPGLEVPLSANVFKAEDKKVIVVTTEGSFKKKFPVYDRRGIGLLAVPLSEGKLDLKDLLVKLAKMGIASVLAEGGGETAAWLLDHHLASTVFMVSLVNQLLQFAGLDSNYFTVRVQRSEGRYRPFSACAVLGPTGGRAMPFMPNQMTISGPMFYRTDNLDTLSWKEGA